MKKTSPKGGLSERIGILEEVRPGSRARFYEKENTQFI
jgi:hypothetical protein